jgi:hypothetical protein
MVCGLFRRQQVSPTESVSQGMDEFSFPGGERRNVHMPPICLVEAQRLLAAERARRVPVPREARQFRVTSWNNGVGAFHGRIITGTWFGGKHRRTDHGAPAMLGWADGRSHASPFLLVDGKDGS